MKSRQMQKRKSTPANPFNIHIPEQHEDQLCAVFCVLCFALATVLIALAAWLGAAQ